ncbi:hypothetical protein [Pedobacter cryoconitis]|uniref:YD repeat-containing protein n=1 Tax=Pedobacter cryoconitis TaxID=188932 RepID=A0A7X0ML02_9SPHI|nr:hypothetical protein [Pedobacter cryoconitis]MBB6500928.1 YD repeat-containing protein [Pedobacter cryoconitis]
MKGKFLFCIFSFCVNCVFAQEEYSKINQVTPPSPTAASLGAYGNYPLSDFRGVPNINIPLAEISLKNTKLPISLSYDPSGIKTDQIAGWVGLGWSLNCGGVITRSVVDIADDFNGLANVGRQTGMLYNNYYKPGLVNSNGARQPGLDLAVTPPYQITQNLMFMRQQKMDTEPDVFYFNFNGQSGKFVIRPVTNSDPSGHQIAFSPYKDIKVQYNMETAAGNPDMSGSISQFILTDEKGDRYYFDVTEKQFSNTWSGIVDYVAGIATCNGAGSSNSQSPFYNSSWYLSKIVTSLGETVNFTYADEQYTYNSVGNISATNSPINLSDTDGCKIGPSDFNNGYAEDQTTTTVQGKRLSAIEGDDFKITFLANAQRKDIPGMSALTNIKVFSKTGGVLTPVKGFDFSYHYMADLSKPQKKFDQVFMATGDSRQHLFLDTIQNKDNANNIISNYQFVYNEALTLPDRFSYQKDFWGYFNNNNCNSPIAKLYIYPNASTPDGGPIQSNYSIFPQNNWGTQLSLPGANRNSNSAAILTGTLTKIIFPTGGYTQFNLEPHTFNFNGQNITGGGLRLQQSISYDGIDHAHDNIKSYSYLNSADHTNSSGVIFNMPIFAYYEALTNTNLETNLFYSKNTIRSDVSHSPLSGFDGYSIGYREITETLSDGSKTLRRYSTPGAFGILGDYAINGCTIEQSGFCDGFFNAVPSITMPWVVDNGTTQGQVLDGQISDETPNIYPFAPNTNYDWNRGLLLTETAFNNGGVKQKQIDYNYQLFTPKNSGPVFVRGLKKGRLKNYNFFHQRTNGSSLTCDLVRYDIVAEYQTITQVAKVPLNEVISEYDASGNVLTNTKTYTYNFNSLKSSKVETDNSDGMHSIFNMTYVNDLDLTQASIQPDYAGYKNLSDNNINALVESFVQQKKPDNSLSTIAGTLVTYKPNLPLPGASYVLRTSTPLDSFNPISVSTAGITKDAHYDLDQSLDQYDTKGNLLQLTNNSVSTKCYLWGFNKQYPIAQVTNATSNNIFYTGFEEGDGNTSPEDCKTGHLSYSGNYNKTLAGVDNGAYKLTYWQKTAGNWSLQVLDVNVTGNSYSIALSGQIDDVRFYPTYSQMTTYTYDPLVGVTSSTDPKNQITYYEYDSLQRLMNIRDKDKNIIKHNTYHYQGH